MDFKTLLTHSKAPCTLEQFCEPQIYMCMYMIHLLYNQSSHRSNILYKDDLHVALYLNLFDKYNWFYPTTLYVYIY